MARHLTLAGVMVALLGGAVWLQIVRERLGPLPLPESGGAMMYVRSPAAVSRVALSYDALAADLYWMRAIQHYGSTKRSTDPKKVYDQLYPLLDLTTSLDPYFDGAYRFGAIFLSESFPDGPGRPDLAIGLLQKGIAAQPHRWQFAQDIGFVNYWWLHRYQDAAEWFSRAADMGGPNWLRPLAAVTLAEGGNRASSRQLWQRVLADADVDWLRTTAEHRLQQLDAMDQLDTLRLAARTFEQRSGTPVRSWEQLIAAGYLRRVPVDPAGYPYQLDAERTTITLDRRSTLNPLPVESPPIAQAPGAR